LLPLALNGARAWSRSKAARDLAGLALNEDSVDSVQKEQHVSASPLYSSDMNFHPKL
jgi:hypothetical protein